MKFSIKDFFCQCDIFTEEILNEENLRFCAVKKLAVSITDIATRG